MQSQMFYCLKWPHFALLHHITLCLRKGGHVLVSVISRALEACGQLANKIAVTLSERGGGKDPFTHVTELRL